MPLHERLADADDDEDALYGILVALMMLLPDAVRNTQPADVLRQNGYCHKAALHTLRLNDLEEMHLKPSKLLSCLLSRRTCLASGRLSLA